MGATLTVTGKLEPGRLLNTFLEPANLRESVLVIFVATKMDDPKPLLFARPGNAPDTETPIIPKLPAGVSWRQLSMLSAPLVFAAVNLVSAHFEKRVLVDKANRRYEQLVGEGLMQKQASVLAAENVGKAKYQGLVKSSEEAAGGAINGARWRALQTENAGAVIGSSAEQQSMMTMAVAGPYKPMVLNVLEVTRLELKLYEGIETTLGSEVRSFDYVGRTRTPNRIETAILAFQIQERENKADDLVAALVAAGGSPFPKPSCGEMK